ncbi:MAG: protein kinase [Gemmataceae bacterium]|nr:protein kinase [Gemmataceae bacterium]
MASSRFVEEARTLARLRHPHIIAVLGAGTLPDGGLFLAMDLADGDLSRETDRPSLRRWVAEAAEGLAHAHAAGVVHRDVKPSNILLRQGSAKVADFGMAHLRGGTPGFAAPEGDAGPKADVYGLGATMRVLLGDARRSSSPRGPRSGPRWPRRRGSSEVSRRRSACRPVR